MNPLFLSSEHAAHQAFALNEYENKAAPADNNLTESPDLSLYSNVELIGVRFSELDSQERSVLLRLAQYCQAMTTADIEIMRSIVSSDITFTHMSGRRQAAEEYFSDIASGRLRYFNIGIKNPSVEINGSIAGVAYTSVLDANAYGAKGIYHMSAKHWFEKRNGQWIMINKPK